MQLNCLIGSIFLFLVSTTPNPLILTTVNFPILNLIFVFIDSTEEENNPSINASNQYLPSTAILIGWQDEESD